jgi:hypothetical protein
MNRFAVFGEKHGIWHWRAVCLAGVVFEFSCDGEFAGVRFFIGTSGDDIIFENQLVGCHRDEHLPFDIDKNFFMGSRSLAFSKYGGSPTKAYDYHGQENDSNIEAFHRTFSSPGVCPNFSEAKFDELVKILPSCLCDLPAIASRSGEAGGA